jgi:hypothetical protein
MKKRPPTQKRPQIHIPALPPADLASTLMGVAWFRRDQWVRMRQQAADADKLHETYEEWLEAARHMLEELRSRGMQVLPVEVETDALLRWCREQGLACDSAARSSYVSELLYERFGPGQ